MAGIVATAKSGVNVAKEIRTAGLPVSAALRPTL
jgi:hypothetical protein